MKWIIFCGMVGQQKMLSLVSSRTIVRDSSITIYISKGPRSKTQKSLEGFAPCTSLAPKKFVRNLISLSKKRKNLNCLE